MVSLAGYLSFVLVHKLRRSRSLELYHESLREPRATVEEVRARQLGRIQYLVRHAKETVPYYRELFHSIGLDPSDVRSLQDFAGIPVLTKQIVRERGDELVSSAYSREALMPHHSGGSTGVPIRFYRDRSYVDAADAGTYRNLSQCGWRPGEMVAFVWGFNNRLDAMRPIEFEARQRLRRFYQFDPFNSAPDDLDRWVRILHRIRPRVLLGYASTIGRLARRMLQTQASVEGLRGVFTTAERLFLPQRQDISRAFGCKVFDLYGSSEVQNIASECVAGNMHVNADFCHLEFDAAEPGSRDRPLIVTSLKSLAFPFIRYRNEDYGIQDERLSCNCGSGFPVMQLTVARQSDSFAFANGRVVHGEFFTHLMYGSAGIENFQFYQTAIDRIVIRIVPSASGADAARAAADRAVAEIKRRAGEEVSVHVLVVDKIEASTAGKHRFTRSDVPVRDSFKQAHLSE